MNARTDIAAFAPGIFADMPGDLYHEIEAMSASGCKKMLQSPQHYRLMRDTPNEPTDAMRLGTAVHCGVLEPDAFGERIVCVPAGAPKRPTSAQLRAAKPSPDTVAAIGFWQAFNRDSIGKLVLSADEHAIAQRCIGAVRSHPAASALLDGGDREVSLFWNDARFGVPCKSREDIFSHGGVTDLKTCKDASPAAFSRDIATFRYHTQAAMYCSGREHVTNESPRFFAFIAVETEPPHAVAVYALPGNAILAGAHLMNKALGRYAEALRTGAYAGYPDTVEIIQLPKWSLTFDD